MTGETTGGSAAAVDNSSSRLSRLAVTRCGAAKP